MREVRIALLEADVALPVVREFVDRATDRAVGGDVLRSVTPGQMVVKIVSDTLTEFLGAERCLFYTSDAADDLLCVDLDGRGIIKKK